MRTLVIVFARAPRPGRAKTRLAPALGADTAAEFHRLVTGELLRRLQECFEVELHSDIPLAEWPWFQGARRLQGQGGLGQRMLRSLEQGLHQAGQVALVGSDCPVLDCPPVARLLRVDGEVALGPATDGGFWGIAARRIHPAMFHGVNWSTAGTLAETVFACRRAGLRAGLGPRLADVDEPRDLAALFRYQPGQLAAPVARWLRRRSKCVKVNDFYKFRTSDI